MLRWLMETKTKYKVSCPNCQRIFFSTSDCETEIECSRCSSRWEIVVEGRQIIMRLLQRGK